MAEDATNGLVGLTAAPVIDWFGRRFPGGPTLAQRAVWPRIAARENVLLVSPTGTGKTLAAFLAILDRLFAEQLAETLKAGLRCVYVSPLRSLGYDIERNLTEPLETISRELGLERSPITLGVRTGDTPASARKRMRLDPPHLLITTPESLALLLSQPAWSEVWRGIEHVIVDEIHALVPTKRGADLAVSLERLSALAAQDPARVGLSATCDPAEPVAQFLVGTGRHCRVVKAAIARTPEIEVESLLKHDEGAHRGLTYRRLVRRVQRAIQRNRTTVIFANTRALTEKLTHDLRRLGGVDPESIAAHHSALDGRRRREVESRLKSGELRAVVTSTSLELGVDIGTADLTIQVGLPGGVSRCLQRVGRSGHHLDAVSRGLLLAATPAELVGGMVTAQAAREGRVEPLRSIDARLDVLCQQLVGMACARDWGCDEAFALVRRAQPMQPLTRSDFEACLQFLAGTLGAAPGQAPPRWTSPRIWLRDGRFGLRSGRVRHWLWRNIGTICSEESVRVSVDGRDLGTLEAAYAERLQPGDRFVLDGRALEFRRLEEFTVLARPAQGDPDLPRWSSDRQSLSPELALEVARVREQAADLLIEEGCAALRAWLLERFRVDTTAAEVVSALFEAQEQASEIPRAGSLLIEESPHEEGFAYTFHAPLSRQACEALGRAIAARLGRRFGRNLALAVADLGWSIRLQEMARLDAGDWPALLGPDNFLADVLEGLDRGELLARRFRHVAATGLMVLRNPDGPRTKVGGLLWVSRRLFPLVQSACPEHPLLKETRREVLNDLLDAPGALAWLSTGPTVRFRQLEAASPFTSAWIDPSGPEPLRFESAADALLRLHARLMAQAGPLR